MRNRFLLVTISLFLVGSQSIAQICQKGLPRTLNQGWESVPAIQLPMPEVRHLAETDKTRFAVPVPAELNPQNVGNWTTLPNGDKLWTVKIQINGALGLGFSYRNFQLPKGSQLYVYRPDGQQILGAYTEANNSLENTFFTGVLNGETAIIEYFEPKNAQKIEYFTIGTVFYAYRNPNPTDSVQGLNDSQPCNVNINCPQGQNYATVKRGVSRILMVLQEGLGWCSGSLIANTDNDGRPYLLTAYHCQDGYTPFYNLWTFYFGYESPTCANPIQNPLSNSLQGCVQRAGWRNSDFLLLELRSRLPNEFNAYFNGWNRDTFNLPVRTAMVHHPQGDVQKISIDNQAPTVHNTVVNWNNNVVTPANHHLKVRFDIGTTEIGSSGAPLFDSQNRIVGQLHGVIDGDTNRCVDVGNVLYGRFAKSWVGGGTPQTRLSNWLDPFNTNALSFGGITAPLFRARVSGYVRGYWGQGISGVMIALSNSQVAVTDTSGYFELESVPVNTNLALHLSKPDNILLNGMSVADIVPISRHILGVETLVNPKIFAADVNFDGEVNTSDMILIRRLVLRIANSYPIGVQGWGFVDENALGIDQFLVNFTGNVTNLNFTGFKRGDLNGTANGYR
jgi:lysyl endopeptidase